MFLEIDTASDVPIYQQIYDGVVVGIASGELKDGDQLPTSRQLAEDIGINMHTVNKSYALLKQDGFISLQRRNGAIITQRGSPASSDISAITALISSAAAQAKGRNVRKEEFLKLCDEIYSNLNKGGALK